MVKQIAVAAKICTARSVHEIHVSAQRLAFAERAYILVYELKLVGVEVVWV